MTAEREPQEEEAAESGEASSNGHPAPEGASPAEASSTIGDPESGLESESESEESLRADWEQLEQEAAQRLLALQARQTAEATERGPEAEEEEEEAQPEDSGQGEDSGLEDGDPATGLRSEDGPSASHEQPATEADAASSPEGRVSKSGPPEVPSSTPAAAAEVGRPKDDGGQRAAQLQALAKAHAQDRMFFYPERVTAGGEVEVFLNRKVSALAGKREIELLGSFNDWQYQQLGVLLQPSAELGEPWWTAARKATPPQMAVTRCWLLVFACRL